MKTVATQTEHTHSEGWIVQCSICSSSVVPNAPPDWPMKLDSQFNKEHWHRCQSKRFLTNGSDTRVQTVKTSASYAENRERSFNFSLHRMGRERIQNLGLVAERATKRKFSPDQSLARSVEMSHKNETSRNFIAPSSIVTTQNTNKARGIPVSIVSNMSRDLNISHNGDLSHDIESSSNFDEREEVEYGGRVVLPSNVVEVNSLGYTVERRPQHVRAKPSPEVECPEMESSPLKANHKVRIKS